MLRGRKIVIGITGSIAAYKIPLLVRLLLKEGAEVQVIMTPASTDFVTPLTLSALTRRPVIIEPFAKDTGSWNSHVDLGLWADIMIFAPVTANTLAKMAHGQADNFLVTAYLSARCPVLIVPAMDMDMYQHPSTQKNLEILKSYGNHLIEPQTGELASGLSGPGRMEEPGVIADHIRKWLNLKSDLAGKTVLVTAGPTYEKIDPVRFIGNHSSGKMGFALAEAAAARGASVTLVTGPVALSTSGQRITRVDVVSASGMFDECKKHFPGADITIMAAAVSDFRVKDPVKKKIKKGQNSLSIDLEPTRDILMELGRMKKKNQFLVGFALETDHETDNAQTKLKSKNLDLIVLNSLNDPGAGFGTPTNKVTLLAPGINITGELKDKREVAKDILDVISERLLQKRSKNKTGL